MSFPTDRPATWFVTGTSRGLGLELVTQLLQRGDQVAATTRSTERLLAALGDRVDTSRLLPLTVDLRDDEQVRQAVRQATERFGGLDVVVNNAGILRDRMLTNMTEAEWDAVIKVHLKGTFAPSRHAAAYWRERSKAGEAKGRRAQMVAVRAIDCGARPSAVSSSLPRWVPARASPLPSGEGRVPSP